MNELALSADNYDESIVIVLSDANFDRYGISPTQFAKVTMISIMELTYISLYMKISNIMVLNGFRLIYVFI